MLKIIKLSSFLLLGLFLCTTSGLATPTGQYYSDVYHNWPKTNPIYKTADENGIPHIKGAYIDTVGGTLNYVTIVFEDETQRLVNNFVDDGKFYKWDSLFIQRDWTGNEDWDNWDYYVKGYQNQAHLYSSDDFGAPTKADQNNWRKYHVNGLSLKQEPGGLTFTSSITWSVDVNDNTIGYLTYDFTGFPGITVGSYVIGYTPYCANDVFLTPVPEPSTMLLMGAGLIALAGVGRRKYFKKDKK